jgi:two-component system, chemotaxis family, response regulator Rcp1
LPTFCGNGPFEVLLVEDEPRDAQLVSVACKTLGFDCHVSVVADGTEALEHLAEVIRGSSSARPGLVLLDLNLPRMDGWEVLRRLRRSDHWQDLPVVIFSTSHTATDAVRALQEGASAFVTKPLSPEAYISTVSDLIRSWSQVAR